jgi:hypothetical protein
VSEIRSRSLVQALLAAGAIVLFATRAFAQAPAPAAAVAPQATAAANAPPATPAATPAPPPPPYSLPWQLRPAAPGTVLRSDTSMAFYEDPATHNAGTAVATMLLASYKVTSNLAPLVRLGFVQNATPDPAMGGPKAPAGTSFINPIVGATYGRKLGSFRLAGFGGVAVPIGQGGGDKPDPGAAGANNVGVRARSAMDNAMFATNYFTGILGVDGAYVDHKLTVQLEARATARPATTGRARTAPSACTSATSSSR